MGTTALQKYSGPESEKLTGRQKVAILCMVLGTELAATVTSKLTPEEGEMISLEIARMDAVDGDVIEQTLQEWLQLAFAMDKYSAGGMDYAREVLEKAYGAGKAKEILRRIQEQLADKAGLTRLRKADPQQLGTMFRNEHPQTTALILAHLDTAQTAAVLKELGAQTASEVVYRMAKMEKVSPDMLQLIERSLGNEADFNFSQGMSLAGGPAAVAQVLNLLAGSYEKELLDGVSQKDQALSEQIKNLMFVFEDLSGLDPAGLQRVLREVDTKQLAMALKAASEELKGKILKGMSQRAQGALKEEMDMMGPVRMSDVEAAQTAIVAQVRALEEAGEIVLGGGADDLVVK
jgi:flagellar motor switch protein FliG